MVPNTDVLERPSSAPPTPAQPGLCSPPLGAGEQTEALDNQLGGARGGTPVWTAGGGAWYIHNVCAVGCGGVRCGGVLGVHTLSCADLSRPASSEHWGLLWANSRTLLPHLLLPRP